MSKLTQEGTTLCTREVVDADWDAVADIINQYQKLAITGNILRERQALIAPIDPCLRIVALDKRGDVIAYCRALRRSSDVPGVFRINVFVSKEVCRQGVGRYLLNVAEEFVRQNGGPYAMANVEENSPRCIEFAAKSGYQTVQHLFDSTLDLDGFDISPYLTAQSLLEDDGYSFPDFETLGTTDENWRKLWELDTITDRDTPGSEYWSLGTADQYRAEHSSMGFSAKGVHFAIFNGLFVGVNIVKTSPTDGTFQTNYSGVLREHRGKGIGQVLKALGIQHAIACGAQRIITTNDERNAPMLAINKKFGFVQQPGFYVVRKEEAPLRADS